MSLSDFCSCWFLLCPEIEANGNGLVIVILNVVGEKLEKNILEYVAIHN